MTKSKFKYKFLVSFHAVYKDNSSGFFSITVTSRTKLLNLFSKNNGTGITKDQILKIDPDIKSLIIIAISPIFNDDKEVSNA